MPEGVIDFLTFIALWVGLMALIGAALAVTRLFRKKEEERPVDPKEYAEKMEAELLMCAEISAELDSRMDGLRALLQPGNNTKNT